MPLTPGKSRAVIGQNIREMQAAGHPHRVAVAAALRNAYDKPKKHRVKPEQVKRRGH